MKFPWVSRRAYELLREEHVRLLGEIERLQVQAHDLQTAAFVNARLTAPADAGRTTMRKIPGPRSLSVDRAAALLEARSAEKEVGRRRLEATVADVMKEPS